MMSSLLVHTIAHHAGFTSSQKSRRHYLVFACSLCFVCQPFLTDENDALDILRLDLESLILLAAGCAFWQFSLIFLPTLLPLDWKTKSLETLRMSCRVWLRGWIFLLFLIRAWILLLVSTVPYLANKCQINVS